MSASFPWQIEKAKEQGFKPCPFCGGDPYIAEQGNERTKKRCIEVGCNSCGIKRKQCTTGMVVSFTFEKLRSKMLEHWNFRPPNQTTEK